MFISFIWILIICRVEVMVFGFRFRGRLARSLGGLVQQQQPQQQPQHLVFRRLFRTLTTDASRPITHLAATRGWGLQPRQPPQQHLSLRTRTTSVTGPLTHLAAATGSAADSTRPLKVMIFMDATWVYYSLIVGRDGSCPVQNRFGTFWYQTHRIDWSKLRQLIARNIHSQILAQSYSDRAVEVVRTAVFTSLRADTPADGRRATMINEFHSANYEVHRLVTPGKQEKCVDIQLAVEMLYMATVPDAYDVAVIITGDKDFVPAMEKTRMTGKRVALCSVRNSCNRDMLRSDPTIRDYDVIWLDDYVDELVVPKLSTDAGRVNWKCDRDVL